MKRISFYIYFYFLSGCFMMSGFQMLDFLTSYSKLICLNGNLKVAKIQMNPIDNPCKRKDSLELIKFKRTIQNLRWDSTINIEYWEGVRLNPTGCVSNLILNNLNLKGTISDLSLDSLIELEMIGNQLTGPIPSFSNLKKLRALWLSDNQLSGNIPNFQLPDLQSIDLADNNLVGPIPIFNLENLTELGLANNKLSGPIPIFKTPKLEWLRLNGNILTGIIPNFNYNDIQGIDLEGNMLTGVLPNFQWLNLRHFNVSKNLLIGNVKLNLPNVWELNLSNNDFSSISEVISPSMGIVFFNNNKLTGKIFNGISQFPNLEKIRLQDNSLTFGSLIPIFKYLNNNDAIYSPQAKIYPDTILIGEISKSLKIDLKIDSGELENIYQWNKNGNPYVTVKGKNYIEFQSLQISDTGTYSVNVTNPNLPKLYLTSGNIKLKVPCSIIQTSKSDTLCTGKSIQFGNQILTKGGIYQEKFISNVGCDSIVTLNLVESNLATVPVTFIEDCQLVANVDISGGNKPFKYLWNTGQTSEIIRGLQSNFNYSLTVTDIKGCSSTGMIKTPLLDKFNVIPSIKSPDCGLKNGEIKLSISGTPPYQIVWKAGTPGIGDSLRTDLVSGTYSLFVRDANNCYDSLTLVMDESSNCDRNYKIFSSFSPNGDGINEYFIIKPISCIFDNLETCFPKNELIIFNRWSDPIFKASPYNNDWDGERYPEGTYFFIFKSGEDNVIEKGFITLIRRI